MSDALPQKMYLVFILALLCCLVPVIVSQAQTPGNEADGEWAGRDMNMGRFYGRVVDGKNNKKIDAASVELLQPKYDRVSHVFKDVVLKVFLTKANGDFNFENIPVTGHYKIKITAVHFSNYEQPVEFDRKTLVLNSDDGRVDLHKDRDREDYDHKPSIDQDLLNAIDKDLGNIKMQPGIAQPGASGTTSSSAVYKMAIGSRSVFSVDKMIVATGGTCADVLKSIPSVNVDIDGNVTLRNATPIIFVNGLPSTLTIVEIPADAIKNIEVMTNPSAMYEASSGAGGIINVVLKSNNETGYSGNLRAGIDSYGKATGGGDFNIRQGNFNGFMNASFGGIKSVSTGTVNQTTFNTADHPYYYIHQPITATTAGASGFARAGFDFFLDNRNTFTLSGNYFHGTYRNYDDFYATTTYNPAYYPNYRDSGNIFIEDGTNTAVFESKQGEFDYKHSFAKTGHELTANLTISSGSNTTHQLIDYYINYPNVAVDPAADYYYPETIFSSGSTRNYTWQSDFVNPFTAKTKLDGGMRVNVQDKSSLNNYNSSSDSGKLFYPDLTLDNNFTYTSVVYAAYAQFSGTLTKDLSYRSGLRVESANDNGTLYSNSGALVFTRRFPLSLFPSGLVSYKLTAKQSLQLNYTRRVTRPRFFQLNPYVNRSDSLALSQGNPNLDPEFTSSYEFNYQNSYRRGTFRATAYYKHTTHLITRNVIAELLPGDADSSNVYIYQNASSSEVYGVALTNRYNLTQWLDFMVNVILYNSRVDAGNLAGLSNENLFSYFSKISTDIKLPAGFFIQLDGDYQSRTIVPPKSSGGTVARFGSLSVPVSTANGYIKPTGGFDLAIKKNMLKNKVSVVFNMQDVFHTRINDAYSILRLKAVDYSRISDPGLITLTFSYRFGKIDKSLFKRKDMKRDEDNSNVREVVATGD